MVVHLDAVSLEEILEHRPAVCSADPLTSLAGVDQRDGTPDNISTKVLHFFLLLLVDLLVEMFKGFLCQLSLPLAQHGVAFPLCNDFVASCTQVHLAEIPAGGFLMTG